MAGRYDGLIKELRKVGSTLGRIADLSDEATTAMGNVTDVGNVTVEKGQQIAESFVQLQEKAVMTSADFTKLADDAVITYEELANVQEESSTGMKKQAQETAEEIKRSSEAIEENAKKAGDVMDQLLGRVNKVATPLDDLLFRLKDSIEGGNIWAKTLEAWVGMLKAGEVTMTQFMTQFGDMIVSTENGTKTIRELIGTLAPNQVLDPIKNTIFEIEDMSETVDQKLDRLRNSADRYSQALLNLAEALRSGSITLDMFLAQLDQVKKATPAGAEANEIADDLAEAALKGLI